MKNVFKQMIYVQSLIMIKNNAKAAIQVIVYYMGNARLQKQKRARKQKIALLILLKGIALNAMIDFIVLLQGSVRKWMLFVKATINQMGSAQVAMKAQALNFNTGNV